MQENSVVGPHPSSAGRLGLSRHHLPTPLTPLIGREQEVSAVSALVKRPEVRLLTITGTGGVGKTRLALHIASDLWEDFADGVCFLSLASITNPDLVLPTIASAFGLSDTDEWPLLERLFTTLREKHLLLVLDNFEQIVLAATHLANVLQVCPGLKMLVTSRAVLHVRGEYEFLVTPLALPDPERLADHERVSQVASVALFLQRTRAILPDFQLTPHAIQAIAEICVRLDGLPLAIELAAARSKLLPPQALLTMLEHRLAVLSSGAQDMPERQQTLRKALSWSYNLLTQEEQRLFRHLSVFVGGCTLETAESIYHTVREAVSGRAPGEAFLVLDGVTSLIDKSLLRQTDQEGCEPRLAMLETVREYGQECLLSSGEALPTQRAHALTYLALAEEAEPSLTSAEQGRWLDRLEREHENLRAACHWFMEQGETKMALRLSSSLWRFWMMRGHLSEGRNVLERALLTPGNVVASIRAKALTAAGVLTGMLGNYPQCEALCGQGLALFRELGDPRGSATCLWILGFVNLNKSQFAVARTRAEEGLALSQGANHSWGIASSLEILATAAYLQGDFARASSLGEKHLALYTESGDTWGRAHSLWLLGLVSFSQGELARARALLEESLILARRAGDTWGIVNALAYLGCIALFQGEHITALELLEESLGLARDVGTRQGTAFGLYGLGLVAFSQGDYLAARARYEESLAISKASGIKLLIPLSLDGLAFVASIQGQLIWAVRLWAEAEAQRHLIDTIMPPTMRPIYEQFVATTRDKLGEEAFAAAWAEGRTMTLEQVLVVQEPVEPPSHLSASPGKTPSSSLSLSSPGLTSREGEVLRLLAQGLTSAQMARQLVISVVTVNFHVRSIYSKLGVSSRSAATRYAIEHHLV